MDLKILCTSEIVPLTPFYVVPGYTFFYWGFTIPKRHYPEYKKEFGLNPDNLVVPITIKVGNKKLPAKLRMAQINNKGEFEGRSDRKYPERNVLQIFWDREYDTKKSLRKMFIYSYATTIKKNKPKLKEVAEFIHVEGTEFRVKAIAKQETDFDEMLKFMEDKNLFEFWKEDGKKKRKSVFLNNSRKPSWHHVDDVKKFADRTHVIYLLHHSEKNQFYVGKADKFGSRIKKGQGRKGLDKDWDKFMFFELDPEMASMIEQIEDFAIRLFSSILDNDLGVKPLNNKKQKLVNKAGLRKK